MSNNKRRLIGLFCMIVWAAFIYLSGHGVTEFFTVWLGHAFLDAAIANTLE